MCHVDRHGASGVGAWVVARLRLPPLDKEAGLTAGEHVNAESCRGTPLLGLSYGSPGDLLMPLISSSTPSSTLLVTNAT